MCGSALVNLVSQTTRHQITSIYDKVVMTQWQLHQSKQPFNTHTHKGIPKWMWVAVDWVGLNWNELNVLIYTAIFAGTFEHYWQYISILYYNTEEGYSPSTMALFGEWGTAVH